MRNCVSQVGPCSAKRPECVDGDGMPIYCTQVRNGHISHRSQTDIWVSEASNLPFYPRSVAHTHTHTQ